MKMKEVCTRTGLTERAVRYYISKGLCTPDTAEKGERVYYEFTEEHLTQLREIALLRGCDFPVDTLLEMKAAPRHIPQLLRDHRQQILQQADQAQQRLAVLDSLCNAPPISLSDLARQLSREYEVRSLPDPTQTLRFGRLDEELPPEEIPPEQTQRYISRQLALYTHTRRNLLLGGILILLITLLGWFVYQRYSERIYTHLALGCDVTFSQKQQDETGYWAQMTLYPDGFSQPQETISVPVKFDSWPLFQAILTDYPYPGLSLTLSVPKREAAKLGIYNPQTAVLDVDGILLSQYELDENWMREHLVVSVVQAELS